MFLFNQPSVLLYGYACYPFLSNIQPEVKRHGERLGVRLVKGEGIEMLCERLRRHWSEF